MKKALFYLPVLLAFVGCSRYAIEKKVVDNYYLIAADVGEGLGLSYLDSTDKNNHGELLEATVFATGYNDKYVIVKQHPRTFPNPPDKKITNYYILPRKKGMDYRNNNGLIGPLTLEQFNSQRKNLNISDSVTFTIVYKDLE